MAYQLLPFRFDRFNENEVFISNEVGEYSFVANNDFEKFVNKKLETDSDTFLNLKSKHIATDTEVEPIVDMLAIKYRTKKSFLDQFTALHMVVVTLRCNSNCSYCQVSKKDLNDFGFDMDKRTAKKVVDNIFKSPSPFIKIEFQGGEPLLNFSIIEYIVEYAELKNIIQKRNLDFVICTNLNLIDDNKLKFIKKYKINISTSLDGQKELHNKNRPLQETENSYDIVAEKIKLCREVLGYDSVSALMTTTSYSIGKFKEIIDEYINQGFNGIFLRSLNPYGFAKRDKHILAYPVESFINNFIEGLEYIIELNLKGTYFVEYYSALLLTRILTPFSTGFVDLQSPAGAAISGVIYDYNGNVFVSDEGRMLAATSDNKFLMGNVNTNNYEEIFNSEYLHNLISNSCLESLPECSYCAYQSFCGADPVRNYSEQGDIIGNRAMSDVCKKNKAIFKYLFTKLKDNNKEVNKVFWNWINKD